MQDKLIITAWDQTPINIYHDLHESKKMLIFTHGMSEYAARHDYLVAQLGSEYNIVSYDVRGHGNSSYSRGYVRDFEHYENDLLSVIEYFIAQDFEISLMGHSMGGLITLGCLHRYRQLQIEKVFLSGPALGAGDKLAVFLQNHFSPKYFRFVGALLRHIPVKGSVDTKLLSHDPDVRERYEKDPIMLKLLKARMVMELLARGNELMEEEAPDIKMMMVSGELDYIINRARIEDYCQKNQIEYHMIGKALHEIHFEVSPMKDQFFEKLRSFFID